MLELSLPPRGPLSSRSEHLSRTLAPPFYLVLVLSAAHSLPTFPRSTCNHGSWARARVRLPSHASSYIVLSSHTEKEAAPSPAATPRGTTPTPGNGQDAHAPASGTLTIRVVAAKQLSLPPDVLLPSPIEKALRSQPQVGSPTHPNRQNRESIQRKQCWWLPYVVLAFDKNEVLIDALGGDLSSPTWMFPARLCVAVLVPWHRWT